MDLPEKLLKTVKQFSRLPGVGEKTALRQSLIMTKWNKEDLVAFAEAIKGLAELNHCDKCGMFCDDTLCKICTDYSRSSSKTLCVVESVTDCLAIERSGNFRGKFHILFGVLSPLMGIGPDELKLDNLSYRVKEEGIEEVILAVNPSVEGDATCAYIKQILPQTVNVDRIGFGIPMGGSLEYVDSLTITKALENRRHL
ncbi:MAG: recombination mediator RecR [Bdellovibrionales bacterium]|nr:recombination mediator RecR [Bdellovibrionales bacterium]